MGGIKWLKETDQIQKKWFLFLQDPMSLIDKEERNCS